MTSTVPPITLRAAVASDAPALDRLAALDSRPLPAGELLVAERDGRLLAAVSVRTLDAVADPFERTADAVALLRRQAVAHRNAAPVRKRLRLVPRAA
ncbi:MAG TPA: hypothetical protein VGW75_15535 [Solirubrobacteraceae bacterium]|nr:hypothetical protein [Solirubrobacteraceae bacterium]